MRLMLTGLIPLWVVLLLFVAISTLVVAVYRKQPLARPWSVILPGLRLLAVALLLLALLQPVASFTHTEHLKGQIPVLVDTSGSMSLADEYAPQRQIDICWQLELFPRKLRTVGFREAAAAWRELDPELEEAETLGGRLRRHVTESQPWTREFKKEVAQFADMLKALKRSASKIGDTVERVVEKTDYLSAQQSPKDKPQPSTPEKQSSESDALAEQQAFQLQADRLSTTVTGLTETLERLGKTITETNKADIKSPEALVAALDAFVQQVDIFRTMPTMLAHIQIRADSCLASAGVAEVDAGIEHLAGMTRSDIAQHILSREPYELVNRLSKRGDVSLFSFDEVIEPVATHAYSNLVGSLAATRMGSVLHGVLKHYENRQVAAVVVLSDGNNNAGKPPQASIQIARERNIPVFAVGIGAAEPPRDVAIERVTAARTVFVDDQISLNVVVARHGYTNQPIAMTVTKGTNILAEATLEAGSDEKAILDLPFAESEGGLHEYAVTAEALVDEALAHNNSKTFAVRVLEDRIRALLIDEFPRWESRYANMTLGRDKRVELTTIFIGAAPGAEIPMAEVGEAATADKYPAGRDELFGYHVLIIGDVDPTHFSTEQLQDIRDFVIERGGTLVTVAGAHHMPSAYSATPLSEVIPLKRFGSPHVSAPSAVPPEGEAPGPAVGGRFPLALAIAGRHEEAVQIGTTAEGSSDLWEGLPNLHWVREDTTMARAATALAVVDTPEGVDRKEGDPVIATSYVGLGKTLYMGSDEFWRWRYRARWTYHHRFWGQIMLWATMGRTAGTDANVKVMVDRLAYAPDEVVVVRARILDDTGTPVDGANASIDLLDAEGLRVRTVPLMPLDNSGGEYRAQLVDLPKGAYKVAPRVPQFSDRTLDAEVTFDVRDLPTSEYVELALNETVLATMSDTYLPFERVLEVVESIPELAFTEEHRNDRELWDTFLFMLSVATLLGLEWWLRKKHKLV
jgi:hypothetical protein